MSFRKLAKKMSFRKFAKHSRCKDTGTSTHVLSSQINPKAVAEVEKSNQIHQAISIQAKKEMFKKR